MLDQEYPAAVLRMTSTGQVHSEKLLEVDGGALMIDLSDALDWLQANLIPQVAEVYRPVVMNGMERDRIHLHPTHESPGIVAYSVLPLHQTVVSLERGMEEFGKAAQHYLGN